MLTPFRAADRREPGPARSFLVISEHSDDPLVGRIEAAALAAGWRRNARNPEVVFVDARAGAAAGGRLASSHRILVAGSTGAAAAAVRAGLADDALVRPDRAAIELRLAAAVRSLEARRQAGELLARARERAARDHLTGLATRAELGRDAATLLRRVRAGSPGAVLMIDVDHFKRYNDRYGHGAGDRVLRAVAGAIGTTLRDGLDGGYRYGGEEFAVLLGGAGVLAARRVAERIRRAVAVLEIEHAESPIGRVSISIGLASLPAGVALREAEALAAADRALYRAKAAGRDRVAMADPLAVIAGIDAA